ncbi:olfactory receptor 5V1-like [Pelobates fuscus]|uniref:olfactory receptor 5V1-like n=1 Tax=Pelobates fuscus TaxID=191477 RepID=UPI002FE4BF62
MEVKNQSTSSDFILLGFSEGHVMLSVLIALTYITILMGNFAIISIIRIDCHLQTPMYFFLSFLSILDIGYSTVTLPAMFFNFVTNNRKISFGMCFTQLYFFVYFGGSECLLLAAMAYDRYVAICNPLRYLVFMNKKFCSYLVLGCCSSGFMNSILHTSMSLQLNFCEDRNLNNFFCDVPPLLNIYCTNTQKSYFLLYIVSVFLAITPFMCVTASYTRIIATIFKIPSSAGRQKAFSTCSSHVIIVTIFYATGFLNYIGPAPRGTFEFMILSPLLYSFLTPLFNPVIYCFRNKEVKRAFNKLLSKYIFKGAL